MAYLRCYSYLIAFGNTDQLDQFIAVHSTRVYLRDQIIVPRVRVSSEVERWEIFISPPVLELYTG